MNAGNLFLIGRGKAGGEWVIPVQDRPKDLDGFRELARERLSEEEVVRCMDCRHAAPIDGDEQGRQICWLRSAGYFAKPDDFCSYGKRRDV